MTKRKKILFIVSRLPINTETGDRVRVYHFIKKLYERGHQVDVLGFVPDQPYTTRTDIGDITHQCVGIKKKGLEFENPGRANQLRTFFDSFFHGYPYRIWQWRDANFVTQARNLIRYHEYDVIHFSEVVTGIAFRELAGDFGKSHVVFDLIDSVAFSLKNALSQRVTLLSPFRFVEQRRLKEFEQQLVKQVDKTILISQRDKDFLEQERIEIIPNGIEENDLGERRRDIDLLFTGNMTSGPNVDAALWFGEEILPKLLEKCPELHFTIAGANPPPRLKALQGDHITVTGFVQDLNEYYRRAKLFVCPMRMGAGQKNKILEAMINRAPVVSTTEGNIGVDAPPGVIAIADGAQAFADSIITLLDDEDDRNRLAETGFKYVKKTFSWERSVDSLEQCYDG